MSCKAWMRSLVVVGTALGAAAPALAQSPPPPVVVAMAEAEQQPAPPVQQQPRRVITDETITSDIKARLEESKLLRNAQVTIASTGGVVTLAGTVPSDFARSEVLEVARSTVGVKSIDDQLRLDISSPSAPTRN